MARQKLSEYRSKQLVVEALGGVYDGWSVGPLSSFDKDLSKMDDESEYVVKVDQGVKGRFKKGLVALGVQKTDIKMELSRLREKGYESFIVEPQTYHEASEERYLALSYDRSGTQISYSSQGGVDIESNAESIKSHLLGGETDWDLISKETCISVSSLKNIYKLFEDNFMTMLEVNPYIIKDETIMPLDAAIEVDDSGAYFVNSWTPADFRRSSSKKLTDEEVLVTELDENSPASLKLEVINPNGSIFLLLSGGGASVVVADEICNLGFGDELANYGEYSGNPNTEETYLYTKALLQLMIKSPAAKKVLFIGGAVANFTDIANTFKGIIQAIDESAKELASHNVQVFVRRGGPRQEIGLKKIKEALEKHDLLGGVYDPSTPLTDAVAKAVEAIK